jgi:choline kinase
MKAIVLNAGQGRRLLPLTSVVPKCLLALDGRRSLLQLQLEALARCGITHALVVTGYGADMVEAHLADLGSESIEIDTIYNPFFGTSDNLISCWLSRIAMDGDFVLLNGDTVFEDAVLLRLLDSVRDPLTVTVDQKLDYDDDDMKVALDGGGRVLAIGKTLPAAAIGGEAIGLIAFIGSGPQLFVEGLERAVRRPGAARRWYLSVVHELAEEDGVVGTASIRGLWWREIDGNEDLARARREWGGRVPSREACGAQA